MALLCSLYCYYGSYTGLYEIIRIPWQIWAVTVEIGFSIRLCVFWIEYLNILFHRIKKWSFVAIFWEFWKVFDNLCWSMIFSFLLHVTTILWQICSFFQWDINITKRSTAEEIAENCLYGTLRKNFEFQNFERKRHRFKFISIMMIYSIFERKEENIMGEKKREFLYKMSQREFCFQRWKLNDKDKMAFRIRSPRRDNKDKARLRKDSCTIKAFREIRVFIEL